MLFCGVTFRFVSLLGSMGWADLCLTLVCAATLLDCKYIHSPCLSLSSHGCNTALSSWMYAHVNRCISKLFTTQRNLRGAFNQYIAGVTHDCFMPVCGCHPYLLGICVCLSLDGCVLCGVPTRASYTACVCVCVCVCVCRLGSCCHHQYSSCLLPTLNTRRCSVSSTMPQALDVQAGHVVLCMKPLLETSSETGRPTVGSVRPLCLLILPVFTNKLS